MFIVWLLTGIWHGANWTFIFWGLMYFVVLLGERFFDIPNKLKNRFVKHLYTLLIVNALWVVFRADDLYQAGIMLLNMLGLNRNGILSDTALMLLRENWVFYVMGIIFCLPVARTFNKRLYEKPASGVGIGWTILYPVVMLFLFVVSVSYLASGTYNPFIYFNF